MSTEISVPDIGDFESIEVIEILVKPGDVIKKKDPIVTLESDKSSVEVPSLFEGKISSLKINYHSVRFGLCVQFVLHVVWSNNLVTSVKTNKRYFIMVSTQLQLISVFPKNKILKTHSERYHFFSDTFVELRFTIVRDTPNVSEVGDWRC